MQLELNIVVWLSIFNFCYIPEMLVETGRTNRPPHVIHSRFVFYYARTVESPVPTVCYCLFLITNGIANSANKRYPNPAALQPISSFSATVTVATLEERDAAPGALTEQ